MLTPQDMDSTLGERGEGGGLAMCIASPPLRDPRVSSKVPKLMNDLVRNDLLGKQRKG